MRTNKGIEIPDELATLLIKNPQALAALEALPPSHQREWVKYITEVKKPETRTRRAEKAIRILLKNARSEQTRHRS
ncbi:MAG: YdeI/OmpD-associated family protein [candidate division WOR-3 bacterium]|nr:YdeI/OmpD-associated family protein [candidate division WOR-3 bacterium]